MRFIDLQESSEMLKMVVILGVPIDNLNMAETLDKLEDLARRGQETGIGHQVATVNVDFIANAHDDPELLYLLQNVSLAMPDGMPLVWAARALGVPMEERVAGVDVVFRLAERAAHKGYSVYLLGAAPGVAAHAAEILQEKFPGLRICGVNSPIIQSIEETDPDILEDISKSQPDILLVAFGNPKQEKWIARYSKQLRVPLMIGVGGTLDFISGTKKRAPEWMQRSGLEWIHRLAQEPGRLWRRYGRDMIVFGRLFARQWWLMRGLGNKAVSPKCASQVYSNENGRISLQGCLSVNHIQAFSDIFEQTLTVYTKVTLDLSQATFLDASALGVLVGLTRHARENGGDLVLVNVPQQIENMLIFHKLDRYFKLDLLQDDDRARVSALAKPGLG